MSNKRLLLIIGFAILAIGFGVLIYFVFIKDLINTAKPTNNANVNTTTNTVTNGGLPVSNTVPVTNGGVAVNVNNAFGPTTNVNGTGPSSIANGGATLARPTVNANAQAPTLTTNGDIRYYDKDKGKFYRRDQYGNVTELTDQLFPKADTVSWSPQGDKAIIAFPDQSKVMYDFSKKTQVTLPKDWDNIQFSQTGTKIGFKNMSEDQNARWLATANPDGSEVTPIEPMGDNYADVAVDWSPSGQVLATYRQGTGTTSQEVFLIGLNGENFKSLTVEGRGFEGMWSSSGDQLLYSVYNAGTNYNPNLYLVDAQGDTVGANKMDLGLRTWVQKCVFSKTSPTLYCAVPNSLPEGAGLFPETASTAKDTIYEVNANTGSKSIIALPTSAGQQNFGISSMMLLGDEKTLYFQDQTSGKIYNITLE